MLSTGRNSGGICFIYKYYLKCNWGSYGTKEVEPKLELAVKRLQRRFRFSNDSAGSHGSDKESTSLNRF